MTRVITYGTFDLLHYGHIRLLERAKQLGDYLIVGVTAEDFDKTRGKINVKQSLMERIDAVRKTGIADEVIVEEYEGQKIDDIKRYQIDIFTVGSDWIGKFDYLKEYCEVVYLDRTEGISSTELRSRQRTIRIGMVGESEILFKFIRESQYVNGMQISGLFTENANLIRKFKNDFRIFDTYEKLLEHSDGIYIISEPSTHYYYIKLALEKRKHVLCESPIVLSVNECTDLFLMARTYNCVLMDGIKTAYSTAYHRMLLLIKSGVIGKPVSVDATCTSIRQVDTNDRKLLSKSWNSISAWGPTALLPIFHILGTNYKQYQMVTSIEDDEYQYDSFTKMDFAYENAVATIKVGQGVKSEGNLVVTGTKGYVYVPAPWWKTEYFETRFEQAENNRRYFYQLEGEGIRYELVSFIRSIENMNNDTNIDQTVSIKISSIMENYLKKIMFVFIFKHIKGSRVKVNN